VRSRSWLLGILLLVTVVVSIGPPVIGIGSFHAADMIGTMPPWSEQTPYDFVSHVGVFSPLTLPCLIAPLWLAPKLTKLLEMGVAALGMILLLRRRELGPVIRLRRQLSPAVSGCVWHT
jgi:hypothetical protein